jgi:hypothetical protein
MVHMPATVFELRQHASPAVCRPFERDPLDGVSDVDIPVSRWRRVPSAIEAGTAHLGQFAELVQRQR